MAKTERVKVRTRDHTSVSVEIAKPTHRKARFRWWIWQASPAFGTAFFFVLGSLCLTFGSAVRLFHAVSRDKYLMRQFVLLPYFTGGLCFTTGCAIPLQRTYHQMIATSNQMKRKRRGRGDREVERAKSHRLWARVDFLGAVVAVVGGVFINCASYIDMQEGSKAELVLTTDIGELWKITIPVMFGRFLFMLAGYFTWAARNHSWSMYIKNGSKHFWWTSVLFWIGASGFYFGWFQTTSPFYLLPQTLVKNWFGVLTGYITGSCFLFAASYIMILELAANDSRASESADSESAMIRV